jgi:hypothetical protein
VEYARKLLESIGLQGQRLQMINISSAMGGQFAFAAAELTAEVQRLGPNPLRADGRSAQESGGEASGAAVAGTPLAAGGEPVEATCGRPAQETASSRPEHAPDDH